MDEAQKRLRQAAGKASAQEAQASKQRRLDGERRQEAEGRTAVLRHGAKVELDAFRAQLFEAVIKTADPEAELKANSDSVSVHGVRLSIPDAKPSAGFGDVWSKDLFDVLATSKVVLRKADQNAALIAVSLWYCDAQQDGKYQWCQAAFTDSALVARRHRMDTFNLDPGHEDAPLALSKGMHSVDAKSFEIVSDDTFQTRWVTLFASALEGVLDDWPNLQSNRHWHRSGRPRSE